jgi:hypothetical protein
MDKLTAAGAVALLRNDGYEPPYHIRHQIAALIESLEADAAAKNIALKEAWEGFTNLADLGVLPGEAYDEEARRLSLVCSKALGTTAGAAMLARLAKAERAAEAAGKFREALYKRAQQNGITFDGKLSRLDSEVDAALTATPAADAPSFADELAAKAPSWFKPKPAADAPPVCSHDGKYQGVGDDDCIVCKKMQSCAAPPVQTARDALGEARDACATIGNYVHNLKYGGCDDDALEAAHKRLTAALAKLGGGGSAR